MTTNPSTSYGVLWPVGRDVSQDRHSRVGSIAEQFRRLWPLCLTSSQDSLGFGRGLFGLLRAIEFGICTARTLAHQTRHKASHFIVGALPHRQFSSISGCHVHERRHGDREWDSETQSMRFQK